jgi:hypothetical protein
VESAAKNFHLAQVNIAWMHGDLDDPVMSGLRDRVEEINQLAEDSKGFIWRLPGAEAPPDALAPFETDFPGFRRDRLFYNMSVWESIEDLREYTFNSAHAELLNERHQWIERIAGASVALWWIPIGHRPTIAESAERLRSIRTKGPTPYAFTLRKTFNRS